MGRHSKITAEERDNIAVWRSSGVSIREIARRLGRSHSSIIDELKRNNFQGIYVAIHAQTITQQRKREARKREPLKEKKIYSYVLAKLKQGWSPEQIAGRLEQEQGKTVICHETIYRFIYAKKNKQQKLWEYLPRKQQKRRKQYGRSVHTVHIPDRVSIHHRPEAVNNRTQFGHWEADTVEGKGHKEGIHTEVERVSRYMLAQKIARIASEETVAAQQELFIQLPENARQSVTMDNGRENHLHMKLKELGIETYFADPYSSWQRGTNEYHNGLLRRYLPKKTPFTTLTQEELDDILWEINNRPRKVLHYLTPHEMFIKLGGRIQLRM